MHKYTLAIVVVASLTGCQWDEGLIIENMAGTVVLPPEALTRSFVAEDGTESTITDPRLIGPVYLGLYSGVTDGIEPYPYPYVGPQFVEGVQGDTYPYGGTTIGDIRFACVEFLSCKLVSGRFQDFDAIIDWFADTLQDPVVDQFGNEIVSGDYLRQTCFDLLEVTSDAEIRITAYEDRDGDGALDLDFTERNDGMWEAKFTLWQQDYFDNSAKVAEDGEGDVHGFTLWGFMDAPAQLSNEFSTCDNEDAGYLENTYNNFFYGGRPHLDVLNQPSFYITEGDWVSGEPFVYHSQWDAPELALGFEVTE
jgi:hypothetical protein